MPESVTAVELWQADSLSRLDWLRHGVTTRRGGGGVSIPPYDALNLGLHVGDAAGSVVENRRRASASLGFPLAAMTCAAQVHGGGAVAVDGGSAGRGADVYGDALPDADALVTQTPGILLALFFADCVPVFLVDPANRVIGLAHAGWRGLVADVVENTAAAMHAEFGSDPARILAAVGPCIGPCCFEVGDEVVEYFPQETRRIEGAPRPHVDLPNAAARHLKAAGVSPANITIAHECTSCLPDRYFSHRRDAGKTGRMAALTGIV